MTARSRGATPIGPPQETDVDRAGPMPPRGRPDPVARLSGPEGVASLATLLVAGIVLLTLTVASPSPLPTGPPAVPSDLGTPSASVTAPSPSLASPTPAASPGTTPPSTDDPGLLANGGFEGTIEPWRLVLSRGAVAHTELDAVEPAAGATALRVDITTTSSTRADIVLRHGGLPIAAGNRYVATVLLRAASARAVRLVIAGATGTVYESRVAPVSTGWTTVVLEFTAIANDDHAALELHLGRSTPSVWVDAVSLRG